MKRRPIFTWLIGIWLLALAGVAAAGPADISNVPPSTLTTSNVRANLMFVLDNSGSMASDYIPDDVVNDTSSMCFAWSGHNFVFFDPSLTYTAPVDASGNSLGDANFSGVYNDGFTKSGSTLDLSNSQNLSTATFTGPTTTTATTGTQTCAKDAAPCNGTPTTSTTSTTTNGVTTATTVTKTRTSSPVNNGATTCKNGVANSCIVNVNISTGTADTFKPYWVTLNSGATDDCNDASYTPVYKYSALTATQKQNYANWYQYYRTRMLMMRSASGRVFAGIDATRFRVGFATLASTFTSDSNNFQHVDDFDKGTGSSSQKALFYSKLYGQTPSGSTPLRPAMSKTGNYFANKVTGQTDPMQYSCQRNYLLLSTDGYWNTGGEPGSYVPKQLDGATAIGNQDGSAARPQLDTTGAKNSLADIAKYYYDTDLRTQGLNNCTGSVANQNVCTNKDPKPGDTTPVYQNMTTYTLGLGVPGVLNYQTNYDTAASGDYRDIVNGAKNWPDPLSSTATGGLANTGNTVTARIDDLWHAAVNGGGRYYSARNPAELVAGLTDALQKIDAVDGAAASASTSTLRPVPGDDWVFIPSYETQTWIGDVGAYHFTIDATTGQIGVSNTAVWSAAAKLAAQTTRNVLFFDSTKATKLNAFTYSNLPTAQKSLFDNLCLAGSPKLSQCSLLTANALLKVTGDNVVNYLAGKKTYELSDPLADNQVFRTRQNKKGVWTPLGDVINGSPSYARLPPFRYTDAGYSAFKDLQKNRAGVLYVASNDGMLHAFRVSDGYELWAFIPSAVMPNLYKLADKSYVNAHKFFVDGTPVIADVKDSAGTWHTILVGGLGGGGKAYYALDVTDPSNPKALWEYTDADMGYTYGEPVITKNKAGTWVVALTSGYNNTTGDGNGHLYVVNAMTGVPVQSRIDTLNGGAVGSASNPSNLGKINAWVDSDKDNTAKRIYGGDMLGNVWRFDFDDNIAPAGREAMLLGQARDPSGNIQPITTQPVLSQQTSGTQKFAVVTVGTGRYLGSSDLGDTTIQSLYSIKDTLGATTLGTLRNAGLVKQVLNSSHTLTSTLTVDWLTRAGWFIDFDLTDADSMGERINVDMDLQLNMLTVATTVPTPTPCSPGGVSWLYFINMSNGGILVSQESATQIVGITTLMEGSNTNRPKTISLATKNDGSIARYEQPPPPPPPSGGTGARRTSWRELTN
jgi:type IV pilus assembly protein PilY1